MGDKGLWRGPMGSAGSSVSPSVTLSGSGQLSRKNTGVRIVCSLSRGPPESTGRSVSFRPVSAPADVTQLLLDARVGGDLAQDQLLAAVYHELRAIASGRLRRERADHTLSTTALVHEAYLRLVDVTQVTWTDRSHFYAVAARAMRRILVDWARAKARDKRGGGVAVASVDALAEAGVQLPAEARAGTLLALDEALERLAARDARKASVVECRYFAGLSIEETAAALDVSASTVKSDWAFARAWLHRELASGN